MAVSILRPSILLSLTLLIGSVLASPQAQAGEKSDLQVQVSLVSSNTLSLGEPILLQYKIQNSSSERTNTYMGMDKIGWMTKTWTDAQGHSVGGATERTWHQKGGSHLIGTAVEAKRTVTGYAVANPWPLIHVPGKYTFTVHTRLPYVMESQAEGAVPEKYEMVGSVAVNDFTFTLNILPRSLQTLRRTAESLKQKVQDAQFTDLSVAQVEALFSMPEADVSSVWQELISDPTTPRYALGLAADQLVHLHTKTAADLVAVMLWEPAKLLEADEEPVGSMELAEMARLGDANLKKYIDSLYAAHAEAHDYSFSIAD